MGRVITRWQNAAALVRGASAIAAAACIALAAGCGDDDSGGSSSGSGGSETVRLAIRGDLPFAAEKDGELTGVDGDIMSAIARKLNLDIQTETMDFSGQLGAIEAGRVDVAIGSIGWQPERAKVGVFTDPTYYAGATIVQAEDSELSTLDDLQGKKIGTVTGYAWGPAIKKIPDAELATYETADAVYADVGTGRIDAAFVDALQDIYTAQQRKDLRITTAPLEVTPEELKSEPAFAVFGKVQLAFYLPEAKEDLEARMTKAIREMYASGAMGKILNKWGADPGLFLVPGAATTDRIGVDRPKGWEPPSVG